MDNINLDELTAEELEELLEKIQAKLDALANPEENDGEDGEDPEDDLPDDLEELEKLVDKILGRKAELESKAQKRSKLIERIANRQTGKKIRDFKENEEERKMFGTDSKEYRKAFLANLQGKPISAEERTALANGSYVIPQETVNKIYGKMELYPLMNAVDVMHIPGTVIVPVEGTVNPANVVAMGTAATDSADTMGEVSLGIYKLIKTIEITADVAAMAIDAFETWLVDRLANKLFRLVTKLIAAGTGSNQPTGLCAASGGVDATGHTYTKAAITYTDVMNIIAALPAEYMPGAAFVMSRTTFFGGVLNIQDTNKKPIVVADVQSPAKFNVLGFPVIIEDEVGTDIVFGDLKEGYAFNLGKDVSIERDDSVAFRTGSSVYRGMALGDGKPTGVGLVRFTKAAT